MSCRGPFKCNYTAKIRVIEVSDEQTFGSALAQVKVSAVKSVLTNNFIHYLITKIFKEKKFRINKLQGPLLYLVYTSPSPIIIYENMT